MANAFCHIELMTTDPAKAQEFYGTLFSWKFQGMPPADHYVIIDPGEDPRGGLMKVPHEGAPPMWHAYVLVESIDETVAQAETLGGKMVVPKTDVEGHGWFAFLEDPQGARLGLWEAAKKD